MFLEGYNGTNLLWEAPPMMMFLIVFAVLAILTCAGLILGACMASARINQSEELLEEHPIRVTSTEPVPVRRPVRTNLK